MLKRCDACGEFFKNGDKVRAVIITHYVELASKRTFALTQPESVNCEELMHENCFDVEVNG